MCMYQRKFKIYFASTNISNEFKNSVIKKDSIENIQRRKHQQYREKKLGEKEEIIKKRKEKKLERKIPEI